MASLLDGKISVKKTIAMLIIVSLSAYTGGEYDILTPTDDYYCQVEDSVKEFIRISASGKTGYAADGSRDVCTKNGVGGIWIQLNENQFPTTTTLQNDNNYRTGRDICFPERGYCLEGGDISKRY